MDIQGEKLQLIEWLAGLSDAKTIKEFITLKKSMEVDWWDEISEAERISIKNGEEELNRGEGIPNEEVMNEVRNKYNL